MCDYSQIIIINLRYPVCGFNVELNIINNNVAKEDQKDIDKAKKGARIREEKIALVYIEAMRKKPAEPVKKLATNT
ncbi:MAG: hypothetical protein VB070_06715 [Clostridiaceae bacterium]|nr:hypothetical protein [Clostridiaceae bacterium]